VKFSRLDWQKLFRNILHFAFSYSACASNNSLAVLFFITSADIWGGSVVREVNYYPNGKKKSKSTYDYSEIDEEPTVTEKTFSESGILLKTTKIEVDSSIQVEDSKDQGAGEKN